MPSNKKHGTQVAGKQEKSSSATRTPETKIEPEYVNYILKMIFDPQKEAELSLVKEDRSKYPVVLSDGYAPGKVLAMATVTIKNSTYNYPRDFDYDYTVHGEVNEETGNGFDLIQEKLYFKNLPSSPTLIGLAEEKSLGVISSPTLDFGHAEMYGNFQLTGTGIFKSVKGFGLAMFGVSTGFAAIHAALIKGWPL